MSELNDLIAACSDLADDKRYALKTRALAQALGAWAPTVQPPAPVPVPVPVPAPAPSPTYLFVDEFDGPAGVPPDPAKWFNIDGITYDKTSNAKAANAFLDGKGSLILRVTREPWYGKQFAGALIGTFQWSTGWPPKKLGAGWPVPFRYEVAFQVPVVAGAWFGPGWIENVDRTSAQGLHELDCGEQRGTFPLRIGANQHYWISNVDTLAENAGADVSTPGLPHVMACEARTTGVTYYLDGKLIATHSGVGGAYGVLLHNVIADLTSWGSGGKNPDPAEPGPWDMKIDYVRVTAL